MTELPPGIEVVGLTTLAPTAASIVAQLRPAGIRLNALAAEAAAAVVATQADLAVGTPSPSLAAAAAVLGFGYRVIS